jgi:hypothetical protein
MEFMEQEKAMAYREAQYFEDEAMFAGSIAEMQNINTDYAKKLIQLETQVRINPTDEARTKLDFFQCEKNQIEASHRRIYEQIGELRDGISRNRISISDSRANIACVRDEICHVEMIMAERESLQRVYEDNFNLVVEKTMEVSNREILKASHTKDVLVASENLDYAQKQLQKLNINKHSI